MTDLRTAAQQALEALEFYKGCYGSSPAEEAIITAIRAALAEPKEKPWRCACGANLYIDEHGAPRSKA